MGGNITSTLLSLVLVPVVYNILNALAEFSTRLTRKISGAGEEAEEALGPQPLAGGLTAGLIPLKTSLAEAGDGTLPTGGD